MTEIDQLTFQNCSNLTSITIPNNVSSISYGVFYGCSKLESVSLTEKITSIGSSAFYNCSRLTSITIPNSVNAFGQKAFYGCSTLASITIPNSVTSIGGEAFTGCTGLKEVIIEDGLNALSIEPPYYTTNQGMFYDAPLETLYLGRTLNYDTSSSSGYSPFHAKNTLSSITIGENVTLIGAFAFNGCSKVTSITIPNSVTSIGEQAFRNCSSLNSINIPEGVPSIGNYTFSGCNNLASVTIPNSMTSIGIHAFSGCSSLASFTMPEGMLTIDNYAFSGCGALTSINIPNSVTLIGEYAFDGCSSLSSPITIPDGITSIGSSTFRGCSSLTSITIPNSVTSIWHEAFGGCSSLTSFTIPESVTSIANYAFRGCTKLKKMVFEDGSNTLTLGYNNYFQGMFNDAPLETLYLGRSLSYTTGSTYGFSPFYAKSTLSSVTVGGSVTSIGSDAFNNCSNLASITLPSSVTSIGNNAFSNGLKEVVLKSATPPSLTSSSLIADYAIIAVPAEAYNDYCAAAYWSDLTTNITIDDADARMKSLALTAEDDKSELHMIIGDENLKYVTNLTISGSINSYDFMVMRNKMPLLRHLDLSKASIVYNSYEHYTGYHTEDNVFPSYGLNNLRLLTLTLPENITSIGNASIASNKYLSEIVIPKDVTSIGQNAFGFCVNLTSVTIPEGVTSIDSYAFDNLSKLTNIILPPTIRNIAVRAFRGCSNLKEIRIPSSVRTIGDESFADCGNLKDVYVYVVEPFSISQNTFTKDGNNFIATLHAPKVSYWDYYYDTQWSQFLSFEEFDEPYENFYLEGDKVLDDETGSIEGEGDNNPDAEMGNNSGLVVEDDVNQELGDVDIEHDGENGGSIIVDGNGEVNADNLNFRINVTGGRWYFFCFPFDVRAEDIRCEGGAEWVFRYYDGKERANNGKGGWKNVTSDGNGNFLKAATGYIFQCSKNDVLVLSAKNGKIKKEDKYNELVEHITQNKQDASWNFVGNPYLSYYEVTSEDYSAPITVWDGSKYIAIRPGDDDYQLAPFEAFFVQKPDGKDKVNYKSDKQMTRRQASEAAEAASARRSRQAIDPNRLLVNVTLGNGKDTDRTRVVFNNDAAMEYETACDAAKFSTQGVPQIYTLDAKAVKYAINERPAAQGSVSLGYSVSAKGTYTIAATRMDVAMCLMDNLTGTVHDLTQGGYEFSSEAGTFDKRFTLFVKGDATAIENVQGSVDGASDPIYNVKGQQVEKMEKGDVYIKDNRKVIK
ncbi:MAG: leucine-rich repeat domain-containing protein [Bacteroidaceae bacterium]|nr:leucine-rich repeat domain-containing protein [Bacteroidaceae bacterium]